MFELKPDFEEVLNRYESVWNCNGQHGRFTETTLMRKVGRRETSSVGRGWLLCPRTRR